MKRSFVLTLILSCLILVISCNKDKKSDTTNEDNNFTNAVSDNTESRDRRVIDEKYRGDFVQTSIEGDIEWKFTFKESIMIHTLSFFDIENGGDLMAAEDSTLDAWTVGNELMSRKDTGEGYSEFKFGTFTDGSTFVLNQENDLYIFYVGAEGSITYKRQ